MAIYYETTNLCELVFGSLVRIGYQDNSSLGIMKEYFIQDMGKTIGGVEFLREDIQDFSMFENKDKVYFEFRTSYSSCLNTISISKKDNYYQIDMTLNDETFRITSNHGLIKEEIVEYNVEEPETPKNRRLHP